MRWFREWQLRRAARRVARWLSCHDCSEPLCGASIKRSHLTVWRFQCAECGATNHFDFSTYPVTVRVRSMDRSVES